MRETVRFVRDAFVKVSMPRSHMKYWRNSIIVSFSSVGLITIFVSSFSCVMLSGLPFFFGIWGCGGGCVLYHHSTH